jgi:steroid 5-alpha reductase family enzyme
MLVTIGWAAAASLMAVLWLVQRSRGNAAIVDVAWSFATAALGAWFALSADGYPARRLVVAAMAVGWGARLGFHLWRRVTSEREDGRYRRMRKEWGEKTQRNMFVFFQIQALWAVMFALPMLAAARNPDQPLGWLDAVGVALWVASLAGASIADSQLARFRSKRANRGKVCRDGLWKYSRHPNYFFEWLHWWAYLALAAGSPIWWIAIVGVATMLWLLTKVTGIPPTEAQALRSRGDAYREYQRTTSAFVPWLPKGDRA